MAPSSLTHIRLCQIDISIYDKLTPPFSKEDLYKFILAEHQITSHTLDSSQNTKGHREEDLTAG